ncbi:ribonuclease H2, subunit C [Auriculariales sp. MPI-PUGE-AT-0066]|nr:ribonuclease H2, subunit C [Auriculariales sp. MPI-PUGE-AT-0066]
MSTALEIKTRPSLPPTSLNLMPFHIGYDGPAPFSTYFHVAPAPAKVGADGQPENPPRERVSSSFRGRGLEGVRVNLPEGYGGIVLQSDSTATVKDLEQSDARDDEKRGGRRKGRAAAVAECDDEESMLVDGEDFSSAAAAPAAKPLVPTGQFDSFILWGADHPVDDVMNDYARGLHEWTQLAAELHKPLLI